MNFLDYTPIAIWKGNSISDHTDAYNTNLQQHQSLRKLAINTPAIPLGIFIHANKLTDQSCDSILCS